MSAYYNEFEPYAAEWLRNLIKAGHIADGEVDERSIADVRPEELRGFTQCHFFAGIGGWSYAARLAGWPDDRPLWTGSCPCQPYSVAGKGEGQKDERDLWPVWFNLIAAVRPPVVMGEQVAAAIGKHWLDRVRVDLEAEGYALGAAVLPACAVDAPHRRDRLWFVADSSGRESGAVAGDVGEMRRLSKEERRPELSSSLSRGSSSVGGHDVADTHDERPQGHGRLGGLDDAAGWQEPDGYGAARSVWSDAGWIVGADGKARRVEPSIRLLAHGVPARVGKLRAFGNAIVPQVAAQVIAAYVESCG